MHNAVVRSDIRLYHRRHTHGFLLDWRRDTTCACDGTLRRLDHNRRDWRRYALLLHNRLPLDFRDRNFDRDQEDDSVRAVDRERTTAERCDLDCLA
jgi:hypothetical protein